MAIQPRQSTFPALVRWYSISRLPANCWLRELLRRRLLVLLAASFPLFERRGSRWRMRCARRSKAGVVFSGYSEKLIIICIPGGADSVVAPLTGQLENLSL